MERWVFVRLQSRMHFGENILHRIVLRYRKEANSCVSILMGNGRIRIKANRCLHIVMVLPW